jgi:hypothetical protein
MLVEQYKFGEMLLNQHLVLELQLLIVPVGNKVGLT